jgi:hypothetical protein
MTDFISTPTLEEVKPLGVTDPLGSLKNKSAQALFYSKKIHENPEFYANEKKRIKDYKLQRYKSDPEYVEKMRKRAIDYYYKKKQERQNISV